MEKASAGRRFRTRWPRADARLRQRPSSRATAPRRISPGDRRGRCMYGVCCCRLVRNHVCLRATNCRMCWRNTGARGSVIDGIRTPPDKTAAPDQRVFTQPPIRRWSVRARRLGQRPPADDRAGPTPLKNPKKPKSPYIPVVPLCAVCAPRGIARGHPSLTPAPAQAKTPHINTVTPPNPRKPE
jgi:hypothetical protein